MNNISGIYIITNCRNGKQYVGQSYDTERRIRAHKNKLRIGAHANRHLQSAWNKYGEDAFSFSIVEYCPIDALDDREMYWIRTLSTISPNGYNMTLGGDGNRGYHWSDVSKEALSASAKRSSARYWQGKQLSDAHKDKLRTAALNRSEETKRKIGESSKRVMADPEIKRRMILHQNNKAVYCVETHTTYYSVGEAARALGVSAGNVSKVCRGRIKSTGGFHFIFQMSQETHPE